MNSRMQISVFPAIAALFLSVGAQAASVEVKVVDQNGEPVEGAIVSAYAEGLEAQSAAEGTEYKIAQQHLKFVPDLLVVPLNAAVTFPNLDDVRHHVYSFSKAKQFQLNLYSKDETRSVSFDNPGLVALGCNIHDGMTGYVYVNDAPVLERTDNNGLVTLEGLPAGDIKLTAWHQTQKVPGKRQDLTINISDDQSNEQKIELSLRKTRRAARTPY